MLLGQLFDHFSMAFGANALHVIPRGEEFDLLGEEEEHRGEGEEDEEVFCGYH